MEIEIVYTNKNGWARMYINGEDIGKNIRIKKDDFFNGDVIIKKSEITGIKKIYENEKDYYFKETSRIVAEHIIKGDNNE